jgi:hypothetical protein
MGCTIECAALSCIQGFGADVERAQGRHWTRVFPAVVAP